MVERIAQATGLFLNFIGFICRDMESCYLTFHNLTICNEILNSGHAKNVLFVPFSFSSDQCVKFRKAPSQANFTKYF